MIHFSEADVRKRCEEIRLLWRSMSKENRAANVREAIYRAAYADGQRDGMEECKRLISTHHAPFHWYFEWLVKKINAKLDEIRQAAGEVTGG